MKRDAYYALVSGVALALTTPSAAQPTTPAPATNGQAPSPTPAIRPTPTNPADTPQQGPDQSSKYPAGKQKTCEVVVIHAGPNQGQVINKCRHSER